MYRINYFSHNWLVPLLQNREFRKKEKEIKGLVPDLGGFWFINQVFALLLDRIITRKQVLMLFWTQNSP